MVEDTRSESSARSGSEKNRKVAVPEKYQYDPEPYEQKDWLYEQYWGELRTSRDIAEQFHVAAQTVKRNLREHGIPRRTPNASRSDKSVPPYKGFYGGDTPMPHDEGTETPSERFEREERPKAQWEQMHTEMQERGDAV